MTRTTIILAALLLLTVSGCAHGAAHIGARPVTGYILAQDDADRTCTSPIPHAVLPSDSVWVRTEWWQSGTKLKSDSLWMPRAVWATAYPPVSIPNMTTLESRWFVRDVGGTSCMGKHIQTPTLTLIPPAGISGLSIVP